MNNPFLRLSRRPLQNLRIWPDYFKRNKQTRRFNSTAASPSQTYKMAAATALSEQLRELSLATPLPTYPNCYPEDNPVDIYRAHLTSILTEVTGVDASIVYPALQWTQTLEKGDLVLPIPALRVKGKKPNELAAEWVEKVFNVLQVVW
jgi:Arginyl tRNA synthetase N terminal domain